MASRQEFLEELTKQTTGLNEAIEQLSTTVSANIAEIKAKKGERETRIRELALSALPDLEQRTIAALGLKAGMPLAYAEVLQLLTAGKQAFTVQLERLKFDPSTYEQRSAAAKSKLSTAEEDLSLGRAPFDELEGIPDLRRLVKGGYGTNTYPFRWWNGQYYRDWKAADAAVEEGKANDWESLRMRYMDAERDVAMFKQSVAKCERELTEIENVKGIYDGLQKSFEGVPAKVLEQLQTKLVGYLSSLDPVPASMRWLSALNNQISGLQEQNSKLGDARSRMTADLATLQSVKTKTARSRNREVPDKYMVAIRSGGSRASFGGSGFGYASPSYISVYDSGGSFFDGLIIGEMLADRHEDRYYRDHDSRDRDDRDYDRGSGSGSMDRSMQS